MHSHHDSIKNLEEVQVKSAAKKKIETEMKMAVSVDELDILDKVST